MKYCFIHVITLLKIGRIPWLRMQHKLGKTISKRKNIDDNDVKKQTSKGLTPKEASAWVRDSGEIIFTTLKFTKTLKKKKKSGMLQVRLLFCRQTCVCCKLLQRQKRSGGHYKRTKQKEWKRELSWKMWKDVTRSSPKYERLPAAGHGGMEFWPPSRGKNLIITICCLQLTHIIYLH